MRKIITVLTIIVVVSANAQVAINYDGSLPSSHTILDIKSDSTGLMIPRLTSTQRGILANKLDNSHEGMIIYDRTGNLLFFWNGSEFEVMESGVVDKIADADNDTYIDVEPGIDSDYINIATQSANYWRLIDGRLEFLNTGKSVFIGDNAGEDDDLSDNNNIFVGDNAGKNNTTGENNIAIGSDAMINSGISPYLSYYSSDNVAIGNDVLRSNTSGYKNTAMGSGGMYSNTTGQRNSVFGYKALYSNTLGYDNISIGHESLYANQQGYYNISIGSDALHTQVGGYRNIAIGKSSMYNANNSFYNTALGSAALFTLTSANGNVAIGNNAGYSNSIGNYNIFIGYQAGYSETGSNKLYIDNSNTSNPLIYGDFSTDLLGLMGNVGINTKSPISNLHILGSPTIASLLITPNEASSGGDAELILSEDSDNTYGMSIVYDGGHNNLYVYGKNETVYTDPLFTIARSGNIGVGTSNPTEAFQVESTSDKCTALFVGEGTGIADATVYSNNTSTGDGIAGFLQTAGTDATLVIKQTGTGEFLKAFGPDGGNEEWNVTNEGVMQFYNSNYKRTIEINPSEAGTTDAGQITFYSEDGITPTIEIDGDYNGDGRITTNEIQITGGSDLSEFFELSDENNIEKGMVVCIDENNPGQLKKSEKSFDKTVAGIVSGANNIKPGLVMSQKGTIADGEHLIALSGRVYCMVDATIVPVEIGDMLTTSNNPGHAMKVTDYNRAQGAIIGKAMTSLKSGKGLVLVLVSLQ
jgi:hypothetical protein